MVVELTQTHKHKHTHTHIQVHTQICDGVFQFLSTKSTLELGRSETIIENARPRRLAAGLYPASFVGKQATYHIATLAVMYC